jgi:hypothetical protein
MDRFDTRIESGHRLRTLVVRPARSSLHWSRMDKLDSVSIADIASNNLQRSILGVWLWRECLECFKRTTCGA